MPATPAAIRLPHTTLPGLAQMEIDAALLAWASASPGRRMVLDVRLRVALLVGLLAGTLLGSALALMSVLDPGLLPALG